VGFARIPCSGIGANGILANPTTLKLVVDKALGNFKGRAASADDFHAVLALFI
jgi:hypothetical protein